MRHQYKILFQPDIMWMTIFDGYNITYGKFGLLYVPDLEELTYRVLFNLNRGYYKDWTIEEILNDAEGVESLLWAIENMWIEPVVKQYIYKKIKQLEHKDKSISIIESEESEDYDSLSKDEADAILTQLMNARI